MNWPAWIPPVVTAALLLVLALHYRRANRLYQKAKALHACSASHLEDMKETSTNVVVEPSADMRAFASMMHQSFVALTREGFDEQQALAVIGQVLAANRRDVE